MLIDHRTYTVRPGALRKQIAFYEKHGLCSSEAPLRRTAGMAGQRDR
jgi:hypothetical protein